MDFDKLLRFKRKREKLPQFTPKSDLKRAEKELKGKNLKEILGSKKFLVKTRNERWDKHDSKVCRDLEKAYHRKDKREIGGWLKSWAKDDKRELRRFEKEMARD